MQPYFFWKNFSSLDKKIIVNKLPNIERASANVEKITIPGRDGFLTQDYGTYQGKVKECECSLDGGDIDDICSWLSGTSEVIFSNEPDKKYKAVIINKIPFSKIIPIFHKFVIQFECQPHKYSADNSLITLTSAGTIFNYGTAKAKPKITIYGSGNITVNINDKSINLTGITSSINIDSELMEAYNSTELLNDKMIGEFPLFECGENSISWTGSVSKVEIEPNWRWV